MGGGAGISVHGAFRVATENTLFAMPETAIGFFPDVGGSHFLAFLDGRLGEYLALTGEPLKADECYFSGLATHLIPSGRIPALLERLGSIDHPSAFYNNIIEEFSASFDVVAFNEFQEKMSWIDEYFGEKTVTEIIRALKAGQNTKAINAKKAAWIQEVLSKLESVSPTSLIVTLSMIRLQKKNMDTPLDVSLLRDYQQALFFLKTVADFEEAVNKRLIMKNRHDPIQWKPTFSWDDVALERNLLKQLGEALSQDETLSLAYLKDSIPFCTLNSLPDRTCFSKHRFSVLRNSYPNMNNGLPSEKVISAAFRRLGSPEKVKEALMEDYGDKEGVHHQIQYILDLKGRINE